MKLTARHWLVIIVVVFVILAVLAFDVWLMQDEIKGDTISALILEGGLHCALVSLWLGILGGHFTWKSSRSWRWQDLAFTVQGIGAALALLQWFLSYPMWFPVASLVLGIPLGIWLWPNRGKDGE